MSIEIIFRNLRKNIQWYVLNLLGLSVALACLLAVSFFVYHELSFDRFHTNAGKIVRFTQNSNTGSTSMIDARMNGAWALWAKETFPEVELYARISSFRKAMVKANNQIYYTKKAFSVDSTFNDVFSYKLITGNRQTLFHSPNEAALSKSTALSYFGTLDVIGKSISIMHQKQTEFEDFTIAGIYDDFPQNSHFKADILCSYDEQREPWAYCYFKLTEGTSRVSLVDSIQTKVNERFRESEHIPLIDLQPLTDIHLHSHKSRELEAGGQMQTIYLMITAAMLILIIALVNFVSTNQVKFARNQQNLVIRLTNGASVRNLVVDFIIENLILLLPVMVLGTIMAKFISSWLRFNYIDSEIYRVGILVSGVFMVLIIILGVFPLLNRFAVRPDNNLLRRKDKSHTVFFFMQMTLAMITLSATFVIHRQVNLILNLHPGAEENGVIAISDNPRKVVDGFEHFRNQLLSHSEVEAVSAVMEEPAGMVTDNFPYLLDGRKPEDAKTLNIMIIDSGFFSFFGLKPLAGTLDMGQPSSLAWEKKALNQWLSKTYNQSIPNDDDEPFVTRYERYVVNKSALAHMGISSPEEAVGRKFRLDFMDEMYPEGEIVGVVDDYHYTRLFDKEKPLVMVSRRMFSHCFLIRLNRGQEQKGMQVVQKEWESLFPDVPFQCQWISDAYRIVYSKEFLYLRILYFFSVVSILLALLGLISMATYRLKARIKEIAIRRVNGGSQGQIIILLSKDYLIWVSVAFILSVPVAWLLMRKWLSIFAYQTSLSWFVFTLSGLTVALFAMLTVYTLSQLSLRRNPAQTLHAE